MICRDSPDATQRRKEFVDWFNAQEAVQRRLERTVGWLRGDEKQSVPTLDPNELGGPGEFFARLHEAFGGKCVYCEQSIPTAAQACLNPFRPPFSAMQAADEAQPDMDWYKWLRWEAHNLYLACEGCANAKATLFPIGAARATPGVTGDALRDEQPLILDPLDAEENPLAHLFFHHENGEVQPDTIGDRVSPRGEATIAALSLNRAELVAARKRASAELAAGWNALLHADNQDKEAVLSAVLPALRATCAENAPFAGLHRQLLWRLALVQQPALSPEWQAFKDTLGLWNGASPELQATIDARRQDLQKAREALATMRRRYARSDAPRPAPRTLERAARERQTIAACKQFLRDRGLQVEDAPGDEAEITELLPLAPRDADVLLVTATQVEARAVLEQCRQQTGRDARIFHIEGKAYHYLETIGGATTVMVQSSMGSGGPNGSTLTIDEAIRRLEPRTVIMVGIAFGVDHEKQRIGNILVAEELFCYEFQRLGTDAAGSPVVTVRGPRPRVAPRLTSCFNAAALGWTGATVQFGLVLSGEKVIDNLDFRERLRRDAPEAIGGEMEGSGLYAASFRYGADWALVKGICDWADGYKAQNKEERQQLAANNAAAFVLYVLGKGGFSASNSPK